MALLNRELTPDEISAALRTDTEFEHTPFDWFDPRYQTVRYRAAFGRTDYERRDTFYGLGPKSPSDCVWMVPCGVGGFVPGLTFTGLKHYFSFLPWV